MLDYVCRLYKLLIDMYFRELGGMYWVGLNDWEKEECMLKVFIILIVLKKNVLYNFFFKF